ncbi:MAG: DNA gyrase subunit A [Deltaproteobacteria bacterium]|nr:DNA gyrase subunit A [Deltaproteobacteria bacterium]MCX7952071.1 DNA gyrase subunit A [Deltaproteobacteria bacterium]
MTQIRIVPIAEEMKRAYLDYAMSVIVGRALPDVRDGLKPVQRRILYAMYEEGLLHNKKHSKCAGVVGTVLKFFHPHGDSSVYDALVRLAQEWNMRYPLIDGQGNFGSIDGDPPAAYRYTEARLAKIGEEMLFEIDKETVVFVPNFDETKKEPVVLPARIPNLIINGADGIAVGMATHIPPHNLGEVIDALVFLIENPNASVEDIMDFIKGPDFPTGGQILGRKGIVDYLKTGKGLIKVRAKAEIIEDKKGSYIVVSEIPYQENKARILDKIAGLVNERVIDGIARIKDESNRDGIRIVIELKRDSTPSVVLNQLFKHTPLQTTYGVIFLALQNNKPVVFNIKSYLQAYLDHRLEVLTKRLIHDLRIAKNRYHIIEGLIILTQNLDEAINIIKNSEDASEAKKALCTRFNLDDVQAQAILDLRLQKLTRLEMSGLIKEKEDLSNKIRHLNELLNDRSKMKTELKQDLLEMKKIYGDQRKTEILDADEIIETEELIEDEEVVIMLSNLGYIKRTPLSYFRVQKRGGKGVAGASTFEEDFISRIIYTTNLSMILALTTHGRVFSFKAYKVPEGSRTAKGRSIQNFLELKKDEKISALVPVREFNDNFSLVLATRSGLIKRMRLSDFEKIRRTGIVAISLNENDHVIGGGICQEAQDIIMTTRCGLSIRFRSSDVRVIGRAAKGIQGITLRKGDEVVAMLVVERESDTLLSVCENGYGKRTSLNEYRLQKRRGRGVIDIKTSGRNGLVVASFPVNDDSELILMTSKGKAVRIMVKDIRISGRNTSGVRLVDLAEGEKVVSASLIFSET